MTIIYKYNFNVYKKIARTCMKPTFALAM
jgi:hypothetical protein